MKHDFPSKIIFLDVDGVINIPPYQVFNKQCLENVRVIIEQTGAKVVVSSSWREGDLEQTKKHFPPWLQEHIIGETCRAYDFVVKGSKLPLVRGNEIKGWVDTHLRYPWHADKSLVEHYSTPTEEKDGQIIHHPMNSNKLGIDYQYVILDDDTDMLYEQKDNFVNTDGMVGLTSKDVEKAIQILNNMKP